MARQQEQFSQASQRAYRVFRDNHRRQWGAVVENKTQAPCGPYGLLIRAPVVTAPPVTPPQKYIDLIDPAAGTVRINYARWLEDIDRAHEEREMFIFEQATDLYKDGAAEAVEKMPPALARRVGKDKPLARQFVLACREGDPWALGFTAERPAWADEFMPEPETKDDLAFLRRGEKSPDPQEDGPPPSPAENGAEAPPTGIQKYNADVKRVREAGIPIDARPTREELDAALELLAEREAEPQPAAAGAVDPSWGK